MLDKAFAGLLQLDERLGVSAADFDAEPKERIVIVVRETQKLWPSLVCPVETCRGERIVCHDHAEPRSWRHLDAFGKPTEILCAPPRAKCRQSGKVWTVPVPWEGKGKHFTKDLEAFALTLMREMPVRRASEILGEEDTRLCRMLFHHVRAAHAALDLSELVHIGVDEMSIRKGHECLTVRRQRCPWHVRGRQS
jgi:transposase